MAELKLIRYLQEEENLINAMLNKFQEQLNKLKVEEMNIISAIRERQFQEKSDTSPQTSTSTVRNGLAQTSEPGVSAKNPDMEMMNIEDIDLSVQEELNRKLRTSDRVLLPTRAFLLASVFYYCSR